MSWLARIFKRKRSYADKIRVLEHKEDLYDSMDMLSDNQLKEWVQVTLELHALKRAKKADEKIKEIA